ncbi:MAG: hypothetical protein HQ402_00375 [Parcubacteria group bacterium]|nr:hypothetical protein [Parcubacteria group bacterium]
MDRFLIQYCFREIYIQVAHTKEGKSRLENLVSETRAICKIVDRNGETGLHIVDVFEKENVLYVSTVLKKKMELTDSERVQFRKLLLEQLTKGN